MSQSSSTIHQVGDAIAIPGGLAAAAASWLGVFNGILTSIVLLTSIGWGIYRMIEIHRRFFPNSKK